LTIYLENYLRDYMVGEIRKKFNLEWLKKDKTHKMKNGCWEEKICLVLKRILDEFKREFRYARLGDDLGQSKRR